MPQVFPGPRFHNGSGTPSNLPHHWLIDPAGRQRHHTPQATSWAALSGWAIQRWSQVAPCPSGCASSPLHPWHVSVPSAASGGSPVRQSLAAPWRGSLHTSGVTRLFVGRHIRAFLPGGRVRVAQSCDLRWLGSKDTLQCPAPRCSRTSVITRMRLPQSDAVGNSVARLSSLKVSMWWGWQPPRTVQWQAVSTPVLAAHEACLV